MRTVALQALVDDLSELHRVEAIRHLAEELERLDAGDVPGLVVRGLGTRHLFAARLRESGRWAALERLAEAVPTGRWREVLEALGYELDWRYVELDSGEMIDRDLEILRRIDPAGSEPTEPEGVDIEAWTCPASVDTLRLGIKPLSVVDL